jgi:hypothetical protein
LQRLIRDLKPQTTLEVGLAFGVSALFICEALRQSGGVRHVIMDPLQHGDWLKGIGLANLRRAGFEAMVEFYELPSRLALPQLEARGVKVDFAFIDGWHTFDHTRIDFFHVDRLLRVGGVLAIDDCQFPAIHKVCRFIAANRSYHILDCFDPSPPRELSLKGKLLRAAAGRSLRIRELLRPEFLRPDATLGIMGSARCIAFIKQGDDTRAWDYHSEF